MKKLPAVLLLGPTGSGKTPAGIFLERLGLHGKRCVHFDFGHELRQVAALAACPEYLNPREFEVIRSVLQSNALLNNEQFPIAKKILQGFCQQRAVDDDTTLVLNGLPRHCGQALAINSVVDIRVAVLFECSPTVVFQRIRSDTGGDRGGRLDDTAEAIAMKLEIFQRQTVPLLDYYRDQGTMILRLPVTAETTNRHVWQMLSRTAAVL